MVVDLKNLESAVVERFGCNFCGHYFETKELRENHVCTARGSDALTLDLGRRGTGDEDWPLARVIAQICKESELHSTVMLRLMAAAHEAHADLDCPLKFKHVTATMQQIADSNDQLGIGDRAERDQRDRTMKRKMTHPELTDRLAEMVENSGLSLSDKVYAMRAALTRVQMNVSPQKIDEPKRKRQKESQ